MTIGTQDEKQQVAGLVANSITFSGNGNHVIYGGTNNGSGNGVAATDSLFHWTNSHYPHGAAEGSNNFAGWALLGSQSSITGTVNSLTTSKSGGAPNTAIIALNGPIDLDFNTISFNSGWVHSGNGDISFTGLNNGGTFSSTALINANSDTVNDVAQVQIWAQTIEAGGTISATSTQNKNLTHVQLGRSNSAVTISGDVFAYNVTVNGDSVDFTSGGHIGGTTTEDPKLDQNLVHQGIVNITSNTISMNPDDQSVWTGVDALSFTYTGHKFTASGNKTHINAAQNSTVDSGLINLNLTPTDTEQSSIELSSGATIFAQVAANITADTVTLSSQSHIGTSTNSAPNGSHQGGNLNLNTGNLNLNSSYLTSAGTVNIGTDKAYANGIKVSMNGTVVDDQKSWIKGNSVNIGSTAQQGTISVTGGEILANDNANSAINVTGGDTATIDLNEVILSGGTNTSINVSVGNNGTIHVGSESNDDILNKDTQLVAGTVNIGSFDENGKPTTSTNNTISVVDAQIGFPQGANQGTININSGSGKTVITSSNIGADNGQPCSSGTTNITGNQITVGSQTGHAEGSDYDTVIGGSSINIGSSDTGNVAIGDALIGSSDSDTVKVEVGSTTNSEGNIQPGQITIGSNDSNVNSSIQGGNIQIGSNGQAEANIDIVGNRTEGQSNTNINGDSVAIGNGHGNINIADTNIGAGNSGDITISNSAEEGNVGNISGTVIDAEGDVTLGGNINIAGESNIQAGTAESGDGSVNFGNQSSTGGTINIIGGSTVSGDNSSVAAGTTVNIGTGTPDEGAGNIEIGADGSMNIDGVVNVGANGSVTGSGEMTINVNGDGESTGSMNVGNGASIVAGNDQTGGNLNFTGSGTVHVEGGKLEANKGQDGSGGDINLGSGTNIGNGSQIVADSDIGITGDVELTGDGEGDAPVISANNGQGTISIGNDSAGSGSLNVGAGNEGIIVGDVTIGNGGSLSVSTDEGNAGKLTIGSSIDDAKNQHQSNQGGLVVGEGTEVTVGENGVLDTDKIQTVGEGESEGHVDINGGRLTGSADSLFTTDENGNTSLGSNISISQDSVLDLGDNELTYDEVHNIKDALNPSGTGLGPTVVVGTVTGMPSDMNDSYEDWVKQFGNSVLGDAVIDATDAANEGTPNRVTQGGGSQVIVDRNPDGSNTGSLTIGNDEDVEGDGHFTLTGTAGDDTSVRRPAVVGDGEAGADDKFDVVMEDDTQLDLGYSQSQGGIITGDITHDVQDNSGKDPNVNVVGGLWDVEGKVDIGTGNLTISDEQIGTGYGQSDLVVEGTINAGNLDMVGEDTGLASGGDITVSGTVNAQGNASITDKYEDKHSDLAAGEINLGDSAEIDRGHVSTSTNNGATSGDLNMKDDSKLTATSDDDAPALNIAGDANIGFNKDGETGSHNPTLNVNGDGQIHGDLSQGGGQINVAGGGLTVGGNLNQDEGFITIDDLLEINGMLDQEKGGSIVAEGGLHVAGSEDAATIGGNVTVGTENGEDAQGQFDKGLTIEAGGNYTNNSTVDGALGDEADTIIGGDFTVGADSENGGSANNMANGILGDTTIAGNTTINNGNVASGSFDAEGSVNLGENAHLNATGDISIGNEGSGDLTVDGGSSVVASDNPITEAEEGNITVAGSAEVTNGTVSAEGDISVGGSSGITVGNQGGEGSAQVVAGGDMYVTGGDAHVYGNGQVDVNGAFNTTTSDNSYNATIEGMLHAGSSDVGNLTVGSADKNEAPNGSFVTDGKTSVNGDFTVNNYGSVSVGFSPTTDEDGNDELKVHGSSTIGDNATVNVAGDIQFGAEYSSDLTFDFGENSTITAGGKINFADGTSFGGDDNQLGGFIIAPDSLDFGHTSSGSAEKSNVTFSGTTAGTQTSHIIGNVTYEEGARFELTNDANGFNSIDGLITVKPGTASSETSEGTLGSVFTTDSTWKPAVEDETKAGLFVDQTVHFGDESGMVVGTIAGDPTVPGINIGKDANVHFDFGDFTNGQAAFVGSDGNTLPFINAADEGETVTINIDNWGLGTGGTVDLGWGENSSLEDLGFEISGMNGFLQFGVTSDGLLTMTGADASIFEGLDQDLGNVLESVFEDSHANSNIQNALSNALSDRYVTTDANGNMVMSSSGNQFIQDVLTVPVAAGAFNIAYDAMFEFNSSINRRVLEPRTANSTAFWADVIATTNKADTIFGNSGYSADLYAGVLGTDTTFDNGALVGIAITVGKADGDAKGAELNMSNDADYYGVSIYGARNFDKWEAKGDIGYLHMKSNIDADFNLGGKVDTDVFTVGGRMGFAAYESDNLKVMPHFGVRYSNFSIDSLNGTKMKDVHVFEAPMGIEVSGKMNAKGWNVAPRIDMSVVPEFGDKKVRITNSGASIDQDVLNSALFNTTLGVSAQKGNVGVDIDYRLGLGNEERENHSFIANIRYQF